MPYYRFSVTRIFLYKERSEGFVLILENKGHKKPVLLHFSRSVRSSIKYVSDQLSQFLSFVSCILREFLAKIGLKRTKIIFCAARENDYSKL